MNQWFPVPGGEISGFQNPQPASTPTNPCYPQPGIFNLLDRGERRLEVETALWDISATRTKYATKAKCQSCAIIAIFIQGDVSPIYWMFL